jgi:hypothetical protein
VKKLEEIKMDACMHVSACVSACQSVSAVVRWNVQLGERFLCGNELALFHATTIFYVLSR